MSTLFNRQPTNQFFSGTGTSQFPTQQQQSSQNQQQQALQQQQQQLSQQQLSQPQLQQQQLQQLQQQQQPAKSQPYLFQDPQKQQQQQQPSWLQSQHNQKKRVIPNHLVPQKKNNFQLNASNSKSKRSNSNLTVSDDQFNIVSFGKNKTKAGSLVLDRNNSSLTALFDSFGGDLSRFDETMNDSFQQGDDSALVTDKSAGGGASAVGAGAGAGSGDVPPMTSIYDLNEDSIKSSEPSREQSNLMNKNPKEFNNLFTRFDAVANEKKSEKNAVNEDKKMSKPDECETSIIVFGYPENCVSQIIQFFRQFGTVLEKFTDYSIFGEQKDVANLLVNFEKQRSNAPISTGPGWIKFTYDNPNSALNALQENGSIFNGNLLGVVPYHKSVIEKLEKKRVFEKEDIGSGNLSTPLKTAFKEEVKRDGKLANGIMTPPSSSSSQITSTLTSTSTSATAAAGGANRTSYVDLKDGSKFFIDPNEKKRKTEEKNGEPQQKLGIWGSLTKYMFGFHDL
ncbi:uncharacterized protein LODBEIA_P51740 [Lodderomyces beijingensis]|uniref:RRM Nup35-type domain-containing protein n=1 Tax=Lodderomyces beijingensis TaxID=1775926 RepID=A0ABP0ZW88_9ASCO